MTIQVLPPSGKSENGIFAFPIRVYYEDTDAGGIVYYANYLKFAERARTEFLRTLNICQQDDLNERKTGFIVRSCHVEYLSSAFLDDALTVTCKVTDLTPVSATVYQEIFRGTELLTAISVKVVYMSIEKRRPIKIPPEMVDAFKQYMS